MLKQRIITALILLMILLPALLAPTPLPFAVLSLLFISAAGWEWARLNNLHGAGALLMGAVVLTGGLSILRADQVTVGQTWLVDPVFWAVSALLWILGGAWMLRFGTTHWKLLPEAFRWALGTAVLWLAWYALEQSMRLGLNFLMSVFSVAWVADIAAYFGGRAFGRRKLAPSISPGKSWEGVWSGMVGVLLVAAAWIAVDTLRQSPAPSLYSLLYRQGWPVLVIGVPALAAMTVVGDLFKSVVKRVAGVKDSSNLLPGHGGVLDRIDALLPLFPLVWAFVLWSRV